VTKKNLIIIALLGFILLGAIFSFWTASDYERKPKKLDRKISRLLREYSIYKSATILVKECSLGRELNIADFKEKLKRLLAEDGLKILHYELRREGDKGTYIFEIGITRAALYILKITDVILPRKKEEAPVKKPQVKIAIVLDDWGYNLNNIKLLDSIGMPLTLSILPNLAYSYKIACAQHNLKNREIILHMPMEPENKTMPLEKGTLMTTMNRGEILGLIETAFKTVPYAKGISNHMGSKATQDKRLTGIVMEELKRRSYYFLDSMAAPNTVSRQEAVRLDLRFVKRDIFLDNMADKEYIASQMDKLINMAKRRGFALGVGHDRVLTLQVIKEKLDNLNNDNIKFVFASELAK